MLPHKRSVSVKQVKFELPPGHHDDFTNDHEDEDFDDIEMLSEDDGESSIGDNDLQKPKKGSNSNAVLACSMYSFCSMSMVLVNKSLASR